MRGDHSELLLGGLLLSGFLLLFCALFGRHRDLVVGSPVVQHVVKVLLSVDLCPRHRSVARLSHFFKQLIELFASISVHMDSVDELALIEKLNARHALGGYQNRCLCELGGI